MQISWDIVIGHPNIRTTFYWQEYIEMTFLWVRYDGVLWNGVNDKTFCVGDKTFPTDFTFWVNENRC